MRALSFLLRILWSPAFFVAVMMFMDALLPFSETDIAIVKDKHISKGRGKVIFYEIDVAGSISARDAVSKSFYDNVNINDEVKIKHTRLFKEWRSVELIRDGAVVAVSDGVDIYYMLPFALFLLVPVLSTCPQDFFVELFWGTETAKIKTLLFIVIIEFSALGLLIKLF